MKTANRFYQTIRTAIFSGALLLMAQPSIGQSNPDPGSLLYSRFGVVLQLQAPHSGGNYYSYDWTSFVPTKNTASVDWVETDWYGNWSTSSYNYTGIDHPSEDGMDDDWYPAGGELYDIEALYFDNDKDYIYVAVVTSIPHLKYYPTIDEWGVGVYDPRTQGWIRPGDLSLNLYKGDPHNQRYNTTWHYNYGIDLTHDNRDNLITYAGIISASMRDNDLGNRLYKTSYNAGGGDAVTYPVNPYRLPDNSDWYVSTPVSAIQSHWEHTNFDPLSAVSQALGIQFIGETETRVYEITWEDGLGNPLLENNAPTYAWEIKIPRALLGADNPATGDLVGIQWVEGCRNDGNNTSGVWLEGTIEEQPDWDVAVAKTADKTNPGVNETIEFTITVTNNSDEIVNDVMVSDLLPAGLLYSGHSLDQGLYQQGTGLWNVGSIPPHTSWELKIAAILLIANEVCNTATLTDYDHFDEDADLSNNSAQICIDSPDEQLDLGVTKSVYNGAAQAGQAVVFTIQITNYSTTVTAHNVVVEDILDANFAYVSSSASTGSYNQATGHWTIPEIEPLSQEQLEITVIANGSADNFVRILSLDETDTGIKNNDDLVSVSVDGSSGGNDGGLESDGSLASLIARRNFNRSKETQQVIHTPEQASEFSAQLVKAGIIAPAGHLKGGISLADLLPQSGPYNSAGYVTTPSDLIEISNARQVFSVDYFNDNAQRMAAILAIATSGEIYNHTKMICDRLTGASLDLIRTEQIMDQSFILGKLVQPDGSIDYAISFIAWMDNGKWVIDNRWHNEEYRVKTGEEIFNFQVWSLTAQSTVEMVSDLLQRLSHEAPLTFNNRETPKTPSAYVKFGYYENGMLHLNIHNPEGNSQVSIKGTYTRHELASRESFTFTMPVDAQLSEQNISIPTGYVFDIDFGLANETDQTRDGLYYADGPWGTDFDPEGAIIDNFNIEPFSGIVMDDALIIERNASVSGSVKTYASLFRALRPGNRSADLTGYGQIEFEASGNGTVELVLSKSSIESWSQQFRTRFSLSPEYKTYTIDLSSLASTGGTPFSSEDLLQVVFNALGDGQTYRDFDIRIENLRFKKGSSDLNPINQQDLNLSCYPNPFRDQTTLGFTLPEEAQVQILLYSIQGQLVEVIDNRLFNSGTHQYPIDLGHLEQGSYFIKLIGNQHTDTFRLNLVR